MHVLSSFPAEIFFSCLQRPLPIGAPYVQSCNGAGYTALLFCCLTAFGSFNVFCISSPYHAVLVVEVQAVRSFSRGQPGKASVAGLAGGSGPLCLGLPAGCSPLPQACEYFVWNPRLRSAVISVDSKGACPRWQRDPFLIWNLLVDTNKCKSSGGG